MAKLVLGEGCLRRVHRKVGYGFGMVTCTSQFLPWRGITRRCHIVAWQLLPGSPRFLSLECSVACKGLRGLSLLLRTDNRPVLVLVGPNGRLQRRRLCVPCSGGI